MEISKDSKPEKQPEPAAPPAQRFLTDTDYRELADLASRVAALQLNEFTIRRHDLSLSLKGAGVAASTVSTEAASLHPSVAMPAPAAPAPARAEAPASPAEPEGVTINAPLNGTFYRSSGPGKPNFSEEGNVVKKGDPVCIVEAMKLFNQIKAPADCKVLKFLVAHGAPVQKGQPIVSIEAQ